MPKEEAIILMNEQENWTDISQNCKWPIITWKKSSSSLAVRKMQMKPCSDSIFPKAEYYLLIKNIKIINFGKHVQGK